MKIDFKNKTVLITGGTRGIGKRLVESFSELNATVIFTGTSNYTKSKIKKNNIYQKLNLENYQDIYDLSQLLIKKNLKIDILINNAGINIVKNFEKLSDEETIKMININLTNQILLTRHVILNMIKNKISGKIINISSIWGSISKEKRSIYSVTKNGINGLTKSLALEYAQKKILVNSVSPGFTNTELTYSTNSKKEIEKIIKGIPLKRMAETIDIANLILFLCSNYNLYITGQNILIDGAFSVK